MITFIVIEPRRRKKYFIHLFNLLFKLRGKKTFCSRDFIKKSLKKNEKTDCRSSTSRHLNKKPRYKKV